ncbi:MAG TPA: hypothetical protein VMG58_11645, partial [Candidatus Sulfotelmatobacter sp.]|nr:hypothetical protein [Candidatus Sulfotelmatobacter sp.]
MDRAQFKADGVAFGRNFQTAYKSAVMYSIEHPAVSRAVQQAYDSLVPLLQQLPQLIFGFMNRRLLLNDFLTDEPSLRLLETELTRRGIAAVTFLAGLKPEEFRQALTVVSAKPKAIEEAGGTKTYLAAHPLTGVRIVAAKRPEQAGDTVLGMDTEAYLMAGDDLPLEEAKSGRAVDVLLHLAQVERAFDAPRADGEILELAGKAAEKAFLDPATDPRAIAAALSRALEEVTPERFLSSLPAARQAELRGRPAPEIAAEVMEDATVGWVTKRLAAAREDTLAASGEEEALRVMMVGLNMTRMVDRLLQKLARTLEEAKLPPALFERIRDGIVWNSLAPRERQERLLQMTTFDARQFRALLDHIKECVQGKKFDEAVAVATHYFGFLDGGDSALQTELPRAPEVLRTLAAPATLPAVSHTVERLSARLPDVGGETHDLLAAALLEIVQHLAPYDVFELAHTAGTALERSLA